MKILKIIIFVSKFLSKCEPAFEYADEYMKKREEKKQLSEKEKEVTNGTN